MYILFLLFTMSTQGTVYYESVEFYTTKAECENDAIKINHKLKTGLVEKLKYKEYKNYQCITYKEIWTARLYDKEAYPMLGMSQNRTHE